MSSIKLSDTEALAAEILSANNHPIAENKDDHLYCYAIIRKDLEMPPGKLSSQAGHAYGDVLSLSQLEDPKRVEDYRNVSKGGSKVTLRAKNQHQLLRAFIELRSAGIPATVVVDREHVFPPHFDGSPIITAVGVGPCSRSECSGILKRFNVL